MLYKIIGPGDQDFAEIEEVEAEVIIQPNTNWREGTIAYGNGSAAPQNMEPTGISGVGPGGTSLIKPNILPGATVPTDTTPTQTSGTRTGIIQYTVQNGDVIGGIASRFGISVNTILWANDLTARSYIRPGDVLKIPPGTGVFHVVKKGDSLGKIASLYGVKSDEITTANNLSKDGKNLAVGQNLFVPGGSKVQTTVIPSRNVVQNGKIERELDRIAAPPPSINTPAGTDYIWPSSDHRINQYYGIRHTGVDIAGKIGNPNYAAKAGKVIKSQCGWNGGYGCYIILDHGGGITTLYGHNSKLLVSVGETVEQGQVIGLLGSTGRSTGPHLHFEVRISGKRTNPLAYVR